MTITREDLDAGRVDFSDIVDESAARLPPLHPGSVLRDQFMVPHGLTAYALAKAIDVPRNRMTGIVNGDRTITADTALRLARYFRTSAAFWMNLQTGHDLDVAAREAADRIAERVQPRAA